MQKSQIRVITDLINQYHKLNLKKFYANIYKKQKDISSTYIGEYSVSEIIELSNRIFYQLERELSGISWKYMPVYNNCGNEYGSSSLIEDLKNLISSFSVQYINKTPYYINRLICYQIQNAFWDKKIKQVPSVREEELFRLKEELELISQHLKKYSKQSAEIIEELKSDKLNVFSDFTEQKHSIEKFINQKKKQLEVIEDKYNESKNIIKEINSNHVNATEISTEIRGILNNIKEKENRLNEDLSEIDEERKTYQETVMGLIENAQSSIKEFEQKNMSFKEKLAFVEEKKKYFDDKLKEAEKITGIYAGAKMSEIFIERKKELEPSVSKWRRNVLIMTIIAVVAILAIFTNIFGLLGGFPKSITTLQLISNSVKTLPFFFLLYYAIAQYNKERNFQEEYAFKSSIAVTLNAFADLTTELKEQFIVDSVTNIYQSPIRYKKVKNKETEDIIETAKELLIKTAKTASDKL